MSVEILNPDEEGFQKVTKALIEGRIVVSRTSQQRAAYGFLIDVTQEETVRRMNEIKGREWEQKPVIGVLREQLSDTIALSSSFFDLLARYNLHWIVPPGLRLVNELGYLITYHEDYYGSQPTISVMVFDDRKEYGPVQTIYEDLLKKKPGIILGGASANLTGQPICYKEEEVIEHLGNKIDFLIRSPWGDKQKGSIQGGAPMLRFIGNESFVVYRGGEFYLTKNSKLILSENLRLSPDFWFQTELR
jgi:tRNA A37 threonylcarbamoyladenosine synthetase subunit TsaC/SUA5/YrdC